MKTHTHSQTALAVLTANTSTGSDIGVAALVQEISADSDGWAQLLPAGHFGAVDGRPHDVPGGKWFIDAEIAGRVIAQLTTAANDMVIDYEHQTLETEDNGKPAPASGWFKQAEWREGSGLWIKPDWTDRAAGFIAAKEYRYLSAVFPYNKQTGEVLALHSAALTNKPGLDGMEPLAALCAQYQASSNQNEDLPMDPELKKLLAALGVNVDDGQQPTDEQMKTAMAALSALKTKAEDAESTKTELAALKAAGTGEVDLSKYVPATAYNALAAEVAVLKAGGTQESIEQLAESARKDGKLNYPNEVEDFLIPYGEQQGVAALKSMLEKRPGIAALKVQQTNDTTPPKKKEPGGDELSAEDLAVLKATGISKEDFLKSKQELN